MWFDLLYAQRYNPHLRPFLDWASFGTAYAETASAADHATIVEMVERHEGPASASIARYWLGRQPDAFFSVRGVGGDLIGFVANLRLDGATPEDLAADPAAALAVAYAERHGPPRAGEQVVFGRFWMDRRALSGGHAGVHARRGDYLAELDGAEARVVLHDHGAIRISWSRC